MAAQSNRQIVQEIYDAMASGDMAPFGAACDPDYVWRLPGHSSWSRRFEGRAVVQRELIGPLFALFAGRYTARAINLVAEGDMVVAEVRGQVLTKNGERYDNEYCFVFRFRDGRIVEVVEYCDTDLIERVLGSYDDALAAYRAQTTG